MKKLIMMTGFILISGFAEAQLKLEIEITGIRNSNGNIMLQLFDGNEEVIRQEIISIREKTCTFTFTDLKAGKYAIRYYHDENMNGKMEANLVGKPLEGYGFSNNVLGKFGPPLFEKWLFELMEDKKIQLSITY